LQQPRQANRTLGMINRSFVNRHIEILAWRPYLKKDIDLLENVQKRAIRMMITEKRANL